MSEKEKMADVAEPKDISLSIQESIQSGLFAQGNWPDPSWWKAFKSGTLNCLIEESLSFNPSLQAMQKRVEAARQHAKIEQANLYPLLFFNADDNISYFSKNGIEHAYNPSLPLHGYEADLSLSFQYEFDFWGKYRNLFKAALGEMQAQEAEYEQAKLILTTSLAQSYFALLVTFEKKKQHEQLCEVQEKRLKLQELLVEGALSSKLPPYLDSENVQSAKQSLLFVQDELEVQKHLINILAGKSPDTFIKIDPLEENLGIVFLPDNLSLNLLARRPDIAAQIWRVTSLAHQVSAAKADYFPNINLNALIGLQSLSFSNLLSSSSKTGSVTPALNLPIFTAGAIRANLREKKAFFDQAVFDYNQILLTSVQEVTDLLSHIQMAFRQKRLQTRAVQDAQERLSLTLLRAQGGLDSAFIVLNQEEELILQKIKDLDVLYNEYAFLIKLTKALGGGYLTNSSIGQSS